MAFDESKHPRAPDGKFGQGGGAASGGAHAEAQKAWAAAAAKSAAGGASKPKVKTSTTKGGAKPAKLAAAKAKLAAAKVKAKETSAKIIAAAKVKAGQIKWKGASDVAKKTAALQAGKVADPKAARAAIAAAKKQATAKAKAVMDSAKAKASAKSAAILAKAGAKPATQTPAQQPTAAAGRPMSDHDLEAARQRVQATATSHELSAAMIYSGHSFEQINKSLRTEKFQDMGLDEARLNQTIGHLDSLMTKSKVGEPTLTYRGSEPHPSFANLQPGQVFVDKAFVSTTTDRNMIFGDESSFNGGVLFHITSPPGTKMAGIPSNYPKEKEMLLGRGTAFRLDREEKGTDPHGNPLRILHVTVVGQH